MSEATDEVGVEENAEPQRPDWLPSNFNSPEDLAKSYTHATQKITEQGQELAQMRSQMDEVLAAQQQAQTQTQTADLEQQLYDAYESGDGRTIAAANAFLVQQAVEQKLAELQQPQTQQFPSEFAVDYAQRKMREEIPDWAQYEEEVGRVIQSTPVLANALAGETNPLVIAESLKIAHEIAKSRTGLTASESAAQELADFNRQNKNAAQTMSGGNAAQEDKNYFDMVKEAKSGIPSFRLP